MMTLTSAVAILLLSSASLSADPDELLTKLTGHDDPITNLSFNPDGTNLLSSDHSGEVMTWNTRTPSDHAVHEKRRRWATSATYSPGGTSYAVTGNRGEVILYDVKTGDETHELQGCPEGQLTVAISPDGRWVASSGMNQTVTIWELGSPNPVARLAGHTAPVPTLEFSPNSKLLVSGSLDGTMIVWEVASSYQVEVYQTGAPVLGLSIDPSGTSVATTTDSVVKIWDISGRSVMTTLSGHEQRVNAVAYGPNGKFIASGSDDGTVKIWAITTGRLLKTLPANEGAVGRIAFSPTGALVAAGGRPIVTTEGEMGTTDIALFDISEQYTNKRIQVFVEKQLYYWEKKGEFEKQSEYQTRMGAISRKTGEFFTRAFELHTEEISEEAVISTYDSEKEQFVVTLPTLGKITVHVPITRAEIFKKEFHTAIFRNFTVEPVVSLPLKSSFKLLAVEVFIPSLDETFSQKSEASTDVIQKPTVTIETKDLWER